MPIFPMDVILDTNPIYSLVQAKGRSFNEANAFVELLTYVRRTNSNFVLTKLVHDELLQKYTVLLQNDVKSVSDAWTSMQRRTMTIWHDFDEPDIGEEVHQFEQTLLKPGRGDKSLVYDPHQQISISEVVRRGIKRIRPASDNGEELRDVVLWLTAIEYAKTKNQNVAF